MSGLNGLFFFQISIYSRIDSWFLMLSFSYISTQSYLGSFPVQQSLQLLAAEHFGIWEPAPLDQAWQQFLQEATVLPIYLPSVSPKELHTDKKLTTSDLAATLWDCKVAPVSQEWVMWDEEGRIIERKQKTWLLFDFPAQNWPAKHFSIVVRE